MAIKFHGETYPAIDMGRLTPGETDAIERVTGLTLPKIKRMGSTCVCEHDVKAHTHKGDDGEQTDDTSCTSCDCDEHESDLPSRVNTAFMWIAIKRKSPTVAFKEVADQAFEDFQGAEEEAADPTVPSPSSDMGTDSQ
jgi:hypothetical protein